MIPRGRLAGAPRQQRRGLRAAGSVIASTRLLPSWVTATAVTSGPGMPSRTVAAAQPSAQAGAGCAGRADRNVRRWRSL